jgi:hypothetical protein
MAGFQCKCKHIIKTGEIPNPNEWLLISDVNYDQFAGKVDSELLYKEMKPLLMCKNCNRLWVFWNGYGADPVSYLCE